MVALREIGGVVLVGIGLTLKRDATIGIATQGQSQQPLHHIEHIEQDVAQLTHLCRVNALMIHQPCRHMHPWSHQHQAKKIDGSEATQRQKSVAINFHCLNYS